MHKLYRENEFERRIVTPYRQAAPGERIDLYAGPGLVLNGDEQSRIKAEIYARFVPSAATIVEMQGTSGPMDEATCRIVKTQERYPLVCEQVSHGWDGKKGPSYSFRGIAQEQQSPSPAVRLHTVRFHLFNFPDFWWRTGIHRGDRDAIECTFDGWKLRLERLPISNDLRADSQRQRSFLLTSVGTISRDDGMVFTTIEFEGLWKYLFTAFSICASHRCPPALMDGFNRNGRLVWRNSALAWLQRDRHHMHWFPRPYPTHIHQLFENGWTRWQNEDKREALRRASEWYWEVSGREITIETRLVLGQMALELLSWVVMVEEGGRLSDGGFDKLPAADKIALLANQLQASTMIPSRYPALAAVGKRYNWHNAAECLAGIRNKLMHPKKKARELAAGLDREAKHEAAEWAVWLIELGILYMLGYEGRYDSRVAAENSPFPFVPWVDPTQSGAAAQATAR